MRHLGGNRWAAACRLCTYKSEEVSDYGTAAALADAHMAVMHRDLNAPEVYVDADELWFLYQAAHFSCNIMTVDDERQDLLESMQLDALDLLTDLVSDTSRNCLGSFSSWPCVPESNQ